MAKKTYRVVHYLNQFFGQVGGEEKAHEKPFFKEGAVGPGLLLEKMGEGELEIVGTVISGDNYVNDSMDEAKEAILQLIKDCHADVVVAGPSFNAGRYGIACGLVCASVKEELDIPAVTAMYHENPGVELYKKKTYILPTTDSVKGMREVLPRLASFSLKLAKGEKIGFPEEEGYIPQGFRENVFVEKTGAVRAVDMLLKKLKGEPFETELPMPTYERIPPAKAVENMREAVIALVTSGGIVPKGNPHRIESHNASKYCKYRIQDIDDLTGDAYESIHGGYDIVYANEDPDRVLPLDSMRALEKEGEIGSLYGYYYVTVGNTTAVSRAKRYGHEIGKDLLKAGVHAVILTST